MKHKKVLKLIEEISNSNPIMYDIFLRGSCCNLYFILKTVFPKAKAYFNIEHIITKIDGKYYDITGEVSSEGYIPIEEMYTDKYKDDESIKAGEMYNPNLKTRYEST